ncbi:MAG TPA: hypothetical protein VHD91_01140 [Gaiellaceae bacterium]|nr:hypothetical protein [Gaiellaceae bacterium]
MDGFFNLGNFQFKSVLKQLTGEVGAGTYRLHMSLEWTATQEAERFEALRLVGDGMLEYSVQQGPRKAIGPLHATSPIRFGKRPFEPTARVELATFIAPAQVEAIEQARSGGPISLHLRMQEALLWPSDPEPLMTTETAEFEIVHQLKASEWVEVLEQFRYAAMFLLQVPIYERGLPSARAKEAVHDLQLAAEAIYEGRFREAVAACRDALEVAYGETDKNLYPELGNSLSNVQNAGKEARFWLVRRAVWAVTNAAKHRDAATQGIVWERSDAVAALTMVASILQLDPPS